MFPLDTWRFRLSAALMWQSYRLIILPSGIFKLRLVAEHLISFIFQWFACFIKCCIIISNVIIRQKDGETGRTSSSPCLQNSVNFSKNSRLSENVSHFCQIASPPLQQTFQLKTMNEWLVSLLITIGIF